MDHQNKKMALVLSGGGARGAYEAGVIHYIRTQLPREVSKKRNFDILCGSSVGAINACFLAATSHNLEYQGQKVYDFWNNLDQGEIYKRGVGSMTRLIGRTMKGLVRNLFGRQSKKENLHRRRQVYFRGLLDASPFPLFLKRLIPWKQISLNVQNQTTRALSVTGTNVHTGKVELFIQKHPSINYAGKHPAHYINIEAVHALASAAIPVLFPAVRISKNYYCDGGLRLNTPLSPAIQLGADKILVIGLHHLSERAEQKKNELFSEYDLPPTLGEVIGQMLKSIFVDRLEYDLEQLNRINKIIEWSEAIYGEDYLKKINQHIQTTQSAQNIVNKEFKKLQVMSIFPSVDMRKMFSECVQSSGSMKKMLSTFERILLKLLDVNLDHGQDFLSFILFLPAYLKKMLELGFEDARSHHDQLVDFFEG